MNLTAFNGTFSRRAATDLLGISVTQLAQLTDRHFLVVQDERFKFYPLVSEYLQPHLQLQQHQNLQARSAAYFLSLLQTRNCTPEDFKDALNAWQYALQHQQWEALHAATSGLRWLGHQSGRQRETAEALRQALPVLERLHPSWAATLGTNLAWLEMRLGLGEQAIRSAQTALNHAQTPQEQLRSRLVLISALRHTGARTEARHHLKAQINQAEGSEDTRALRQAQELLAVLEEESGNAAQAEMIYLNLLATSREQQPEELARVLHNYANSLLNQSRPAEARTMLQEALILLPADHAYKPIIQLHLADADRQERHFARTLNTCTALMPLLAEQPNLSALVYEVQARTLLDLQRPQAAVQAARQALLLTWRVGLIPKVLEQLAVSVEILLTFPEPTRDTQRLHAALLARPELPNWSRKNLPPCRESTSMPLVEMVSLCLQELADQHNKFPTGGH